MEIDLKEGNIWLRKPNAIGNRGTVYTRYSGFITHHDGSPINIAYHPVEWDRKGGAWKILPGWESGITADAPTFLAAFEPCIADEYGGVHTVVAEPGPEEDLHRPGAKEHPGEGDVYTPRLMSGESCKVVVMGTNIGPSKSILLYQELEQHGSTLILSSTDRTFPILKQVFLKRFKLAPGLGVAKPEPTEDLHRPGAKEGLGTKVDLLFLFECFPRALEAVCRLSEFGEKKYSRGGFREVPNGEIEYRKAMLRHTMKRYTEGDFDLGPGGSNLLHGVAEAWNALVALEFEIDRHGGFEAPEALVEQEERQP